MSISGFFLIIFLLLHGTINFFSVFDAINGSWGTESGLFFKGCEFMALPIVTVMVPVLAFGFIIHIVYACYLTARNIDTRGGYKRYAVASKAPAESWASKNMLALGIVVLGILAFHLTHFWADMQLQQFTGGVEANPYDLLEATFQPWWMVVIYIVWFGAIWFHLTHGFWSAFQTLGLSNTIWMKRLYVIGYIVSTFILLLFVAVAVVSCLVANGVIA